MEMRKKKLEIRNKKLGKIQIVHTAKASAKHHHPWFYPVWAQGLPRLRPLLLFALRGKPRQ